MGQYYIAIILAEKEVGKNEIIRIHVSPFGLEQKLMEHSYLNNYFVNSFEALLTPEGIFYKSRVVWSGDYADNEVNLNMNLSKIADTQPEKEYNNKINIVKNTKEYRYVINHTKKEYVDKNKYNALHPLPLLTAEGNGRGGGDYRGVNEKYIGCWSRDIISIEKEKPEHYTEFLCNFEDN